MSTSTERDDRSYTWRDSELTSPPLPLEQLNEGIELTRSRQWQRVAIQP